MEARELRIGNYYTCTDDNELVYVDDAYSLYLIQENRNAKPIPLTEEWLLKFGFKKDGANYCIENFRFHINKPCNYDGFIFCEEYSVLTDKIQYVHQLQNLYFALTNKELTI